MAKVIVNLCPTGMIPTRAQSPHVPLTPAEIVADVLRCGAAGAAVVHLHARDERGAPTWDPEVYREIITGIRASAPELVICVSTSGRNWPELAKRAAVLALTGDAKPDMASLTLSSLNFSHEASLNAPEVIQSLAARMLEAGIKPELEAFDAGMINYARYLLGKGLLQPPCYFNLILGNVACAQATLLHLGVMVNDLPAQAIWSVGGIGDWQLPMNASALAHGGGVRVGLEDNLWYTPQRDCLATNLALVERVVGIARALGHEPASPREVRTLLGLDAR